MKNQFKVFVSVFFLLLFSAQFSYAENNGVAQLKSFLKKSSSFSAAFDQSLFDENGVELQFSAGQFSLKKPGKFSWDYEEPYPQVIMSNGKKIWMYDSELEQVTIKQVDSALSKTSMVLLFSKTEIDKDFNILQLDVKDGISWLELTAKKQDSDFSSIIVGMKKNTIAGLRMIDGFGQTTVISFSNVSTNPDFSNKHFEFNIPKNADVIGGQ